MKLNKNTKLIILVCSVLLLLSVAAPRLGSVGIITGYQGLEPSFNSVMFKNQLYTAGTTSNPNYVDSTGAPHRVSALSLFDHVNFDPDGHSVLFPNLKASMQPVTVDTDYNPKTYEWELFAHTKTEGNKIYDVYQHFQIQEFRCSWRMNIWLDGDINEAWSDPEHIYQDAQIWIKLTPRRFVYYSDNPKQLFFAPVYIGLRQNAIWRSGEHEPNSGAIDYEMAGLQDIFPESQGEVMGIFYTVLGQEINVEREILSFQGVQLDPAVFREEYWIRIGIDRLGAEAWKGFPNVWDKYHKYPSAQLDFQVNIFTVGEWEVKLETGSIPELEPHEPYYVYQDWAWLIGNAVGNFFLSPLTYVWVVIAIVIVYFVAKIVGGARIPFKLAKEN